VSQLISPIFTRAIAPHLQQGELGCPSPVLELWTLPENQLSKAGSSHGKYTEKRLCYRLLEIHFAAAGAICPSGLSCFEREDLVTCIHKANSRN